MVTSGFNLTRSDLKRWFDEFNEEYFDKSLPAPLFTLSSASARILGKLSTRVHRDKIHDVRYRKSEWYTFTITMYTRYDRSEYWLKNTFLHEMIHEWQVMTFGRAGHRTTFHVKADEINRKGGWQISVHSKPYKEEGILMSA